VSLTKLSTLAAVAFLAIAPPAQARSADSAAPAAADFVQQAAIAGLFEEMTSRLAAQSSSNPDIQNFAQRMIKEHGDANNALKMTARASGGEVLPQALDADHQKRYDELKGKRGTDFDALYITFQSDAHFQAVALYSSYARAGTDDKLKAYAAEVLPTLKAHQDALAHLGAR
jgi:putative membrane protein